jgi:hypothetical protein
VSLTEAISGQMLGRSRVSLNAIAETSTVGLIQAVLDAGVQLQEVRAGALTGLRLLGLLEAS